MSTAGKAVGIGLTFIAVCFTGGFFRAQTFTQAAALLTGMVGVGRGARLLSAEHVTVVVGVMTIMVSIHWLLRDTTIEEAAARLPWWGRGLATAALVAATVLLQGKDRAFIYFQV